MINAAYVISVIARDFFQYLSLKDVVSLDRACLNKKERRTFHETLARVKVYDIEFNPERAGFASWILQRRLLPQAVRLDITVRAKDIRILTELSRRVTKVVLQGPTCSKKVLQDYQTRFPAWILDRSLTDSEFINFTTSCSNLANLTISDPLFDIHSFRTILEKCTKLTHIDISNCEQLMASKAISTIGMLCPLVLSLHFTHTNLARSDELCSLAEGCLNLTVLSLSSQPVGMDMQFFASDCPRTMEVLKLHRITLTGAELSQIATRCPHLREVHIPYCTNAFGGDNQDMVKMLTHASALQVLNVRNCDWFDQSCFLALQNCTQLRTFSCDITLPLCAEALAVSLPHLQHLEALGVHRASMTENIHVLFRPLSVHCTQLKSLYVCCSTVQQSDLDTFTSRCTQLTKLVLNIVNTTYTLNTIKLRCLTHLELSSKCTLSEDNLLQIVVNGSKLRTLKFYSKTTALQNQYIVHCIVSHCPALTLLTLHSCTEKFHTSLQDWQARCASIGRKVDCKADVIVPPTIIDNIREQFASWYARQV